jgi:hypothetical protein
VAQRIEDRPSLATTGAGWTRRTSRALVLLIVAILLALLLRAGRDAMAEAEGIALDMTEKHLRNLVWLEGERTLASEGVQGLGARVGQDPRQWAHVGASELRAEGDGRPEEGAARGERWHFDAARGELVYRVAWLPERERRWRVVLQASNGGGAASASASARGLRLERVPAPDTPPPSPVPPAGM